ncbi:MAG: DUF3291 domain-containing protein [Sinomicrobium sp.]|nr:DUF3291 domain-containing protein [Sinomicrobium sp.]
MIIVATELHIRDFWKFFPFIKHASRSMRQAKRSPGIIYTSATNRGWRVGFTLTAWQTKEAMIQFRNSGAHKAAIKQTSRLSHQYKTLVWEADAVPDWEEAKKKLEKAPLKVLR